MRILIPLCEPMGVAARYERGASTKLIYVPIRPLLLAASRVRRQGGSNITAAAAPRIQITARDLFTAVRRVFSLISTDTAYPTHTI